MATSSLHSAFEQTIEMQTNPDGTAGDGGNQSDQEPATKKPRMDFGCDVCDSSFTTKRALVRHEGTELHRRQQGLPPATKFVCTYCPLGFTRDFDRTRHENEKHRGVRRISNRVTNGSFDLPLPGQLATVFTEESEEVHTNADAPVEMSQSMAVSVDMDYSHHTPITADWSTDLEVQYGDLNHASDYGVRLDHSDLASADDATSSDPVNTQHGGSEGQLSTVPTTETVREGLKQSLVLRKGHLKTVGRPRTLFCAFCSVPYESMDNGLLMHLDSHLDALRGSHTCHECGIDFKRLEDLQMHLRAAEKDDCGFKFDHQYQCTGHHPAGNEQLDLYLTDRDYYRLRICLCHWEDSQFKAYQASISTLVSWQQTKGADSFSIEVLPRRSYTSLSSYAISIRSLASAPCDRGTDDVDQDVRGLQRQLQLMSLRSLAVKQNISVVPDGVRSYNNMSTVLSWAIRSGDVDRARQALREGADPNVEAKNGWPALHYVVCFGKLALLRLLLIHNANVSTEIDPQNLKELSGRCSDYDEPRYKAPPLATTPLALAVCQGLPSVVSMLLAYGSDATDINADMLLVAASFNPGGSGTIEALRAAGVDIDQSYKGCSSILCHAATTGRLTAARSLLECGASPNIQCAIHGDPLSGAISSEAVVALLLEFAATASRDIATPCPTCVCTALARADTRLVKLLLDQGAVIRDCECLAAMLRPPDLEVHPQRLKSLSLMMYAINSRSHGWSGLLDRLLTALRSWSENARRALLTMAVTARDRVVTRRMLASDVYTTLSPQSHTDPVDLIITPRYIRVGRHFISNEGSSNVMLAESYIPFAKGRAVTTDLLLDDHIHRDDPQDFIKRVLQGTGPRNRVHKIKSWLEDGQRHDSCRSSGLWSFVQPNEDSSEVISRDHALPASPAGPSNAFRGNSLTQEEAELIAPFRWLCATNGTIRWKQERPMEWWVSSLQSTPIRHIRAESSYCISHGPMGCDVLRGAYLRS